MTFRLRAVLSQGSPSGVVGALAALLLIIGSDRASALECGEIVIGVATLEQDLSCDISPALTVRGRLDLNGFTVTCEGADDSTQGVVLRGRGSSLRNGTVTGCAESVVLAGRGGHLVTEVTASGINFGFLVTSGSNSLLRNRADSPANDAFRVDGRRNLLSANTVTAAADDGFDLRDELNRLVGNVVTGALQEGFDLRAARNWIIANTVIGAGDDGIQSRVGGNRIVANTIVDGSRGILLGPIDEAVADGASLGDDVIGNAVLGNAREGIVVDVTSLGNRIAANQAVGNDLDLRDLHPDCDDNLWLGNVFETAEPEDCID